MTTEQSFAEMIHIRGIHKDLGISSDLVRNYRAHLKKGRNIKLETKTDLLEKAGYDLVQKPKWARP